LRVETDQRRRSSTGTLTLLDRIWPTTSRISTSTATSISERTISWL
jgi:hypothetical protein